MEQMTRLGQIARMLSNAGRIHHYEFYYAEKSLAGAVETIEAPFPLTCRETADEDLNELRESVTPETRRYFDHVMRLMSTCYVARHEKEFAGYIWANRTNIIVRGRRSADLPENSSFTHAGYVFPQYRGKKVFQSLLSFVYSDLKCKGCLFTGAFMEKDNIASIKARRPFHPIFQDARILSLPGIRPIYVGKRPVLGISVSGAQVPER